MVVPGKAGPLHRARRNCSFIRNSRYLGYRAGLGFRRSSPPTPRSRSSGGFGGNDLIARTLARAGWKLSARTVGRIRKERWPTPRVPEAASTVPRAVRAKRPNHVWMVDLTDVKGLFGIVTFKVVVAFDAFSRMPLSARVFSKEASALEIARFVSRTA